MGQAILVENLVKKYGTKEAVKGISFEVKDGEIYSLLGVNGAGKTTTIKMLCGLAKPTKGKAVVYGHDVEKEIEDVKKIVNVSPQETSVAPKLTVKENLEFMAGIYGADKATQKKKAKEMIQMFGMEEVKNQKAKTLSGGWQRKLSIAMALITEPKLLFLDEPTLGLDVLARRDMWEAIRKMKGKLTIILTTHYMEEAESLSDGVAVMVDGTLRAKGTVDELIRQNNAKNLEEAFVKIAEAATLQA